MDAGESVRFNELERRCKELEEKCNYIWENVHGLDMGTSARFSDLERRYQGLDKELEQMKDEVQCLKEEREARKRSDESKFSSEASDDRLREEVHTYRKVLKKIADTDIEGDLECDGYAWIQRTAKMALRYYNRL